MADRINLSKLIELGKALQEELKNSPRKTAEAYASIMVHDLIIEYLNEHYTVDFTRKNTCIHKRREVKQMDDTITTGNNKPYYHTVCSDCGMSLIFHGEYPPKENEWKWEVILKQPEQLDVEYRTDGTGPIVDPTAAANGTS